jgi:hypothetical protein
MSSLPPSVVLLTLFINHFSCHLHVCDMLCWPALLIRFVIHAHNLHVSDRRMQHVCQCVDTCVVMSGRELVSYVRVFAKRISNAGQTAWHTNTCHARSLLRYLRRSASSVFAVESARSCSHENKWYYHADINCFVYWRTFACRAAISTVTDWTFVLLSWWCAFVFHGNCICLLLRG